MKISFKRNLQVVWPRRNQLLQWLMSFLIPLWLILSFSFPDFAQNKVSGRVTNDAGEGIAGASVIVKGTTSGATTDNQGNYAISAARGAVLVISNVGHTEQEITVGNSATLNVKLSSTTGILAKW